MKLFNLPMKLFYNWIGAVALSVIVQLILHHYVSESVNRAIGFFVMGEAMFPIVRHYIRKKTDNGNKTASHVLFLKHSIGAFIGGIVVYVLNIFLLQYI